MNTHPFLTSSTQVANPLDLIHTDLHGPFKTCTHLGYCYWITFIDDNTCFWTKHFLHTKDQALDAFKIFKAKAENHWGQSEQ